MVDEGLHSTDRLISVSLVKRDIQKFYWLITIQVI